MLVLTFAAMCAQAAEDRPVVETTLGKVRGVIEDGVAVYRGIPYAAPPTGEFRWRATQPAKGWEGTLDAADFGPVCPQMRPSRFPEDEDCLTLNVWTPEQIDRLLPVMVWIHGGAHVNGSGRKDAASFAHEGVVLVAINYRLGRFGVFAHPDITASLSEGEPTGNFGLMDQIAALEWVRREIAAFGGDPGRITIFGVSAGAADVNLLMASPRASGLFHRAIAESGGNGLSPGRGLAAQERIGVEVVRAKGTDNVRELRRMPWKSLVDTDAAYRSQSTPIVDGIVIREDVPTTFRTGRQNNVPYIAGANSFEGSLSAGIPIPAIKGFMNENIEDVTRVYGMKSDDPALYLEFYGDVLFVAPSRFLASQMRTVSSPAWLYHFDYVLEALDPHGPGARHGGEVTYVFNRIDPITIGEQTAARLGIPAGEYAPSPRDRRVAAMVQRYWIQFARTGSPNDVGQPVWPAYDDASVPALLISNDGIGVRYRLRREQLDLVQAGYEENR
jgi:para-nitrobenzyl esterase